MQLISIYQFCFRGYDAWNGWTRLHHCFPRNSILMSTQPIFQLDEFEDMVGALSIENKTKTSNSITQGWRFGGSVAGNIEIPLSLPYYTILTLLTVHTRPSCFGSILAKLQIRSCFGSRFNSGTFFFRKDTFFWKQNHVRLPLDGPAFISVAIALFIRGESKPQHY